jgi:hypothetical protein
MKTTTSGDGYLVETRGVPSQTFISSPSNIGFARPIFDGEEEFL